jgi:hypothetical protein
MHGRVALTVRMPRELLDAMKAVKHDDESLNDMIVALVEHEVARRQGLEVFNAVNALHERILAESGRQPSSLPLLRAMREGEQRRD